jgi:hypothetical protein
MELRIFYVCTYLCLRMLSRSRIFPTLPFSDLNIWVENFLENTQKFYDGEARCWEYKSEWITGYIRGAIRCLGEVSTPCRPVTPAVGPVSRSGKRNKPQSKCVCQERSDSWYKLQSTPDSISTTLISTRLETLLITNVFFRQMVHKI